MGDIWLPILVGVAIIIFAVAIVRLAPNSVWGQELRRSYGIRPSGLRGNRTRRDHFKSAALSAVVAVVLEGTSYATAVLGGGVVDDASVSITETYTFVAFTLASMAVVATIRSLWKAMLWRVELPDTPAHRRGLADAIDHLLDGNLSSQEREDFLDVRYIHPQLEQIRRATVKLAAQHHAGVPDDYRNQIKQWTAGIRASVELSSRA